MNTVKISWVNAGGIMDQQTCKNTPAEIRRMLAIMLSCCTMEKGDSITVR